MKIFSEISMVLAKKNFEDIFRDFNGFGKKGKTIKLKSEIKKTQFYFGDISDIAGKEIKLIERNQWGDCLCIIDGKGLIDVDKEDIERYD